MKNNKKNDNNKIESRSTYHIGCTYHSFVYVNDHQLDQQQTEEEKMTKKNHQVEMEKFFNMYYLIQSDIESDMI